MAKRVNHFTLTLDWDETRKRWKLTYVVQLSRGVASHWRWVETTAEVDAWCASTLATAVAQELQSHLL